MGLMGLTGASCFGVDNAGARHRGVRRVFTRSQAMNENDHPQNELPSSHDTPASDAPADPARRRLLAAGVGIAGLSLGGCNLFEQKPATPKTTADLALDRTLATQVKHIVVIYAENRSFTNLYGNYPGVQSPLSAVPASLYTQLDRDGLT